MHSLSVSKSGLTEAVQAAAASVFDALRDAPLGAVIALEVQSPVEDFQTINLLGARRHDGSARVHVVGLDGIHLDEEAEPLLIDLEPVKGKNGTLWYPSPGGPQPEVIDVDDTGGSVTRMVDTDRFKLQLTCACGNVRYALRSAVHQVDCCRVCTASKRHAYQVQWQRKRRKSTSSRPKRTSSRHAKRVPSPPVSEKTDGKSTS